MAAGRSEPIRVDLDFGVKGTDSATKAVDAVTKRIWSLRREMVVASRAGIKLDPKKAKASLKDLNSEVAKLRSIVAGGFDTGAIKDFSANLGRAQLAAEELAEGIAHLGDKELAADLSRTMDSIESMGELKMEVISKNVDGLSDEFQGLWSTVSSGKPLDALKNVGEMSKKVGKHAETLGKSFGMSAEAAGSFGAKVTAALPFVAVAAAAAGAVVAIMKAQDTLKKLNGEILDAAGGIDLLQSTFGSFDQAISGSDVYALSAALSRMRGEMDAFSADSGYLYSIQDATEALKGFSSAGASYSKVSESIGGLTPVLETSTTYATLWGKNVGEVSKLVGDWTTNLGYSVEGVRGAFSQMTRDAAASGMNTEHFMGIVSAMTSDMGVYSMRINDVSAALRNVSKAGLGAREAGKLVDELVKGLSDMPIEKARRMAVAAAASGQSAAVQASAMSGSTDAVNKLTKGMKGVPKAFADGTASIDDIKAVVSDPKTLAGFPKNVRKQLREADSLMGKFKNGPGIKAMEDAFLRGKVDLSTSVNVALGTAGLKNGLADLADASNEQIEVVSKTTGISEKSLRQLQDMAKEAQLDGQSTAQINKLLAEEVKLAEDQIKKDKQNAESIATAKTSALEIIGRVGDSLWLIFGQAIELLEALGIFDLITGLFEGLAMGVRAVVEPLVAILKPLFAFLRLGKIFKLLGKTIGFLIPIIGLIFAPFAWLAKAIILAIAGFKWIADKVSFVADGLGLFSAASKAASWASGAFGKAMSWTGGVVKSAGSGLMSALRTLGDGFVWAGGVLKDAFGLLKSAIQSVTDIFVAAYDGVKKFIGVIRDFASNPVKFLFGGGDEKSADHTAVSPILARSDNSPEGYLTDKFGGFQSFGAGASLPLDTVPITGIGGGGLDMGSAFGGLVSPEGGTSVGKVAGGMSTATTTVAPVNKTANVVINVPSGDPTMIAAAVRRVQYEEGLLDRIG